MDRDSLAMPKHSQLFKRLDLLQRAHRESREPAQETRMVSVEADMAQSRTG